MGWRLALQWVGIGLIAAGCASSGNTASSAPGVSVSQEEAGRCAQTGGRWNSASATCERGAGGGGGY